MLHFEQRRCEQHNREFNRFLTYIRIYFLPFAIGCGGWGGQGGREAAHEVLQIPEKKHFIDHVFVG